MRRSRVFTAGDLPIAPPQRTSLRETAYRELYDRIVDGTLPPGMRLGEEQIARRLETSRGPVHDALRQLEQEGLVVSVPGKGLCVAALSREDVEAVYEVRIALERLAVQLIVGRASRDGLDSLDALVAKMRACEHPSRDMMLCASGFHRRLCELSGNNALVKAWEALARQVSVVAMQTAAIASAYRSADDVAATHQAIVDALRSGDAAHAARVLEEHRRHAAAGILEMIDRRSGASR